MPIFRRQIEIGGPVTVTHPDMTRFFMSISEAVQLVLQAASMTGDPLHQGGVFILSMGDPVKIIDVAHKMISHEMLVGSRERSVPTVHPLIDALLPAPDGAADIGPGHGDFRNRVELLLALGESHADRAAVIDGLRTFLPTYEPFSLADSADGPFAAGRRGARRQEDAMAGEEAAAGPEAASGSEGTPGAAEAAGREATAGTEDAAGAAATPGAVG